MAGGLVEGGCWVDSWTARSSVWILLNSWAALEGSMCCFCSVGSSWGVDWSVNMIASVGGYFAVGRLRAAEGNGFVDAMASWLFRGRYVVRAH